MRLTSAHSSPRDYVAPSSPPWWCPTIAPPQEKRLSLPARYSQLIWPAHARLENARRKQRGGRFIALERLLSSNSFAWIHPILRVYEVWNFLFATRRPEWYSMSDNYSFVETYGDCGGIRFENDILSGHYILGIVIYLILSLILVSTCFGRRVVSYIWFLQCISKSETSCTEYFATIFQKSRERCLLMFNVSLRVSFIVKRRSRNRNLRDLCGNSHEQDASGILKTS